MTSTSTITALDMEDVQNTEADAAGESRGDRAAFVDANYQQLYRWFWWLTRCPEQAADLTQDTFAAYWASLERTTPRRPRVWLYRIARNRWRNWLRDRRFDTYLESGSVDAVAAQLAGAPDDAAMRDETTARMRAAMEALSPSYREAITLRIGGELSYREIGRVLGIPAALARWRVHQARQQLQRRLGENGNDS